MIKLGKAFSDNVFSSKRKLRLTPYGGFRGWGARITIFYIFLIGFFFLLSMRLFHLSVVQGAQNRNLSEENRVRTVSIHAARGMFYDRKGVPLTKNVPSFRVTGPCVEGTICRIRLMNDEERKSAGLSINSVYLERDFLREYIYPYETAPVLGFLGEIAEDEINNPLYAYQDYLVGDLLGRSGLESVYEKQLRGINGKELIEVDSENNRIRSLGKVDAQSGKDIHLSLDVDLQKVAYEAMGESPGAVIVTKSKTGEILALVSTPSFNANKMHTGMTEGEYAALTTSTDKPLFNKAVAGVYPPGSTFKLVSAIAGLESGKITPNTIVDDIGILRVGEFSFANWYFTQYGGTEGPVNMLKAIARSNDIYFYKLGEEVGIDTISDWGKKMGIGSKTGIELTGEAQGIMPDREYQQKIRGTPWYLGDSYHIAIGQGDLLTTPLQVNRWTSTFANGGLLCPFTLLKQTDAGESQLQKKCIDLGIKKEHLDTVVEGMRRTCSKGEDVGYQGTGWPLFDFMVLQEKIVGSEGTAQKRQIPIACKTGTAEIGDPDGKTHAWFTAFAPVPGTASEGVIRGEPEITVTVLIEKGGEGSSVAGPISKKIFEEWFSR